MIAPADLTDEMILRFGRSKLEGTAADAICRHLSIVALGLFRVHDRSTADMVADARARICNEINARNGASK